MRVRRVFLGGCLALSLGLGSAWAQLAVTDPATTGRNAAVAVLKDQILDAVRAHHERLRKMARRLSADTNLGKYVAPEAPRWETHDANGDALAYGDAYRAALAYGDVDGGAYREVARTRQQVRDALASLNPVARDVLARALATLDAADSANMLGTHQVGVLRTNGASEQRAIDALESDVVDPSDAQSTTAVLDKVSAAALIETRLKQARLQYLTSILEQLVIENKRARDTEAASLNMQLHRLRAFELAEDGGGLLTGAGHDLRSWRQP